MSTYPFWPFLSVINPKKGPRKRNTMNGKAMIVPVSWKSKLNLVWNISPAFDIKGCMLSLSNTAKIETIQKSALNFLISLKCTFYYFSKILCFSKSSIFLKVTLPLESESLGLEEGNSGRPTFFSPHASFLTVTGMSFFLTCALILIYLKVFLLFSLSLSIKFTITTVSKESMLIVREIQKDPAIEPHSSTLQGVIISLAMLPSLPKNPIMAEAKLISP